MRYVIRERLAWTADGRLVPYEHPEARFLAFIPGAAISRDEAERLGLLKQAEPVEDKRAELVEDKGINYPAQSRRAKRMARSPQGTRLGKRG